MLSSSRQPKPTNYKYESLLSNIRDGYFKLPKFQREFVWPIKKSAELLDSIVKGYPIGTFVIWQTHNRLGYIKNLGNVAIPDTPKGYPVKYILDGQQRLASIYVAIKGLTINNKNYEKIYLDLKGNRENELISLNETDASITIYELLNSPMDLLYEKYKKYITEITKYNTLFETYDFSVIELYDYPIYDAVDIFTRINTTGKALSLFEIMAAKTYDKERKFHLSEKYENMNKELEISKYKIPKAKLLQSISVNLIQKCSGRDILDLDKKEIIDTYDSTAESIKKSIDYFKEKYNIQTFRLLPYDSLLVLFQYFFFKNKNKPNFKQANMLQEYFWKASLTSRFSSSADTKLEQDCKRIEGILKEKKLNFDDLKVTLTDKDIRNHKFTTGDAISKSILCLLSSLKPKSFIDNSYIVLDESNLTRGNSKNYHHFFPKAYLKKQQISNENLIANITLIGAEDNLKIGSKPPSEYIKECEKNTSLSETLSTHLIGDLDSYGIRTNNYKLFIKERSKRICQELEKRFNPQ